MNAVKVLNAAHSALWSYTLKTQYELHIVRWACKYESVGTPCVHKVGMQIANRQHTSMQRAAFAWGVALPRWARLHYAHARLRLNFNSGLCKTTDQTNVSATTTDGAV